MQLTPITANEFRAMVGLTGSLRAAGDALIPPEMRHESEKVLRRLRQLDGLLHSDVTLSSVGDGVVAEFVNGYNEIIKSSIGQAMIWRNQKRVPRRK